MYRKEIKKVVEISKEELAELERDSYKAWELEDKFNDIMDDIEDILWKDSIGVEYDFIKILTDIKEEIEYTLKVVNSEPEEVD